MNTDRRFDDAIPDALALIDAIHGGGSYDDVHRIWTTADIPAVLVVLAALVPDDQTVPQLLAWNRTTWSPTRLAVPVTDQIRALHAEHRRLREAQKPIPDHVADGERIYQQTKKRGQRARTAA